MRSLLLRCMEVGGPEVLRRKLSVDALPPAPLHGGRGPGSSSTEAVRRCAPSCSTAWTSGARKFFDGSCPSMRSLLLHCMDVGGPEVLRTESVRRCAPSCSTAWTSGARKFFDGSCPSMRSLLLHCMDVGGPEVLRRKLSVDALP